MFLGKSKQIIIIPWYNKYGSGILKKRNTFYKKFNIKEADIIKEYFNNLNNNISLTKKETIKIINSSNKESDTFDFVGISGGIEKDCVNASIYNVGDRIGQIIIMPYPTISFLEVDELSSTERADGGFGHTGL